MSIINSTPAKDGYYMPAEYDRHEGTIMIWPVRPGSWPDNAEPARRVFKKIAEQIVRCENVYMLADSEHVEETRQMLDNKIKVIGIDTDDAWARDMCPTFVRKSRSIIDDDKTGSKADKADTPDIDNVNTDNMNTNNIADSCTDDSTENTSGIRGINWKFNAWGGEYDGLYMDWEKDDKAAVAFCDMIGYDYYDAAPFVLEGGSIHSDGEGTFIVTENCLLSKGRNPELSKAQIEDRLKEYLGAKKVIWLPYGIYNDETNEHVDNVCAFTSPANVVLAWTDNEDDPQYNMSLADMKVLEGQTDAQGRKINVHKLYIPDEPVCITEKDLEGYVFAEGEDNRELGERLAASYANFYIANDRVLVPQFGDDRDKDAIELLERLMPDRKIIGIYARDIIVGGGNIHCITQQIPAGKLY